MSRDLGEDASRRAQTSVAPEDDRKPDSPTQITKPSWKYLLKKTFREFVKDNCADIAAGLTYFGVLAIAPGLLALVSLLGLIGDPETTVAAMLALLQGLVPQDSLTIVETIVASVATAQGAGLAFVVGLLGALWSASAFVTAFSRGMNRIYEIDEGRPFWKLRPTMLLVTVTAVVLAVIATAIVVLSGPLAQQLGDLIGLGETALLIWNIAKWPVLVVIAILMLAILYYATPNIRQPKFRWMSLGAFVALLVWAIASAGFGFYIANFGNYNETYGSLGGVIVFLLWLWISNNALLFGAEFDAELERTRQLQGGIVAEETVQLPPRDTTRSDKAADKRAADVREGRNLRKQAERARPD